MTGSDELSNLAGAVNVMLVGLEEAHQDLEEERLKSETLLLNVLPEPIAQRLKRSNDTIADSFSAVTVLFADVVGFTPFSARATPAELVGMLNNVFSAFDEITERYGLEKIKTIGDAHMVAAGLPFPRPDHAEAIAEAARDMQQAIIRFCEENNEDLSIRIGVNTGPVVAGVIGTKKFIYDLWGDTVNTASRMESSGLEGRIQVTEATYLKLQHRFVLEDRGTIEVKGKGEMHTYLLNGLLSPGDLQLPNSESGVPCTPCSSGGAPGVDRMGMAALRWSSRASTICTESRQTPASQAAEDADCSGANPLSANPCRRVRRRCVRFGMSNEFCHSEPQARNLRRKRRARRQVGAIHELPLQCYQAYAIDSSSRHVRARNDRAGCWLHLMNILDDSRSTPPLTGFSTSAKVMSDPYPGGTGLTIAEGSPES